MKKLLIILLILVGVLGSITLTSCDKDDDNGFITYQETLEKYVNSTFEGEDPFLGYVTIEFGKIYSLDVNHYLLEAIWSREPAPTHVGYDKVNKHFFIGVYNSGGITNVRLDFVDINTIKIGSTTYIRIE